MTEREQKLLDAINAAIQSASTYASLSALRKQPEKQASYVLVMDTLAQLRKVAFDC